MWRSSICGGDPLRTVAMGRMSDRPPHIFSTIVSAGTPSILAALTSAFWIYRHQREHRWPTLSLWFPDQFRRSGNALQHICTTPGSTSRDCVHSRCLGPEVYDEYASAGCSGLPRPAAQPGIQIDGGEHSATRFRRVHGTASCFLRYAGVGARLGSATHKCPARPMGATNALVAWVRAISQCYRSPHGNTSTRLVAISTEAGPTIPILSRRNP
jgi:hypothetical protein